MKTKDSLQPFRCPRCGTRIEIQDSFYNTRIKKCPSCFRVLSSTVHNAPVTPEKTGLSKTFVWKPSRIWFSVLTSGLLLLYLQYAIQWSQPTLPFTAWIHGIWCDTFDCVPPPARTNQPYWIQSHQLAARTDQPHTLELTLSVALGGQIPHALPPIHLEFINLSGESRYQTTIPIQEKIISAPWTKVKPGIYPVKILIPDPGDEIVNYTLSFISSPQLDTIPST